MEVLEQAQEFPQIAVGAAQMETLYGSIAGIVVGASLGGNFWCSDCRYGSWKTSC